MKLLSVREVQAKTSLSRFTIRKLEMRGDFPRHRTVSSRSARWLESEVDAWIESLPHWIESLPQAKQGEGKEVQPVTT